MPTDDEVLAALARVTAQLPGGGEDRPGQQEMARAVARATEEGRHLVVQAGTGTGKSLGYLVPLVLSGQRVVVATATKALQDQLASKDLPFLDEHLGRPFTWAVLKGRSNYVCLQRVREVGTAGDAAQLDLGDLAPGVQEQVRRLAAWSGHTETGERAEIDWALSDRAWAAVSVSSEECPGATRCPMGEPCFAEAARRRAAAADVTVVNTHLYGIHVGSGGVLLPDHDVVVVDEAHQLEDIASDTTGFGIAPGRFHNLTRVVGSVLTDPAGGARLVEAGLRLADALAPHRDDLLPRPLPDAVADALAAARLAVDDVLAALRTIATDVAEAKQRVLRAQKAASTLAGDLDLAMDLPATSVAWAERDPAVLAVAPLDVAPVLRDGAWSRATAVLTSATVPPGIVEQVGLPPEETDVLDVGSPFDHEHHGLLYCATHLPDPRRPGHSAGVADELVALITAAGGRTLALFTSRRAMREAADAVRPRIPFPVLTQDDLPKPALVARFRAEESTCLFATAGLFQGIDVPGRSLSLVTIDRIPFPRPDEPLLRARRERFGAAAFRRVDLPRASTLLAQAAGRLIRSATDRGVVAVLDPRLASAGYRWDVIRALPPMRRTRHRDEVEAFLRDITGGTPEDQALGTSSR